MKKIFLSILTLALSATFFAQSAPVANAVQAEFKYNKSDLQKAIEANNIAVSITNLIDGPALENFDRNLGNYKNFYSMVVGKLNSKGVRECVIVFKNNTVQFGIVQRLFVSVGIAEVIFDGKKMKTEDFFNQTSR